MSAVPKLLPFRIGGLPEVPAISSGAAAAGATANAPDRAALVDSQDQEQAASRLEIIQPLLDYDSDPLRFQALRLRSGAQVNSKSLLAQYLCELHGMNRATLFRWQQAWRRGGRPALADRQRRDLGQSRWFQEHPDAKLVAAAAYLRSGQSKFTAWEAVERWCSDRGLAAPHYNTVRAWIDGPEVPAPVKVWARDGDRVLNERMLPFIRRDYSSVEANQIWISDHMIHDTLVRNDCFPGERANAPVRLRFTCIIDFRSRKVLGYSWTLDGSSRSIASALRMAIGRYGPCLVFYVDNGEDYKRVARGADYAWSREPNPQCAGDAQWIEGLGVLQRLGIGVQHCLKYHPQSKHIERFFRTVHLRLDAISLHYTGGAPSLRPEGTEAALIRHQKLLRDGRPEASPLMPASEFIRAAVEWIETNYNARHAHRGSGMKGRTPNEVFDEGCPEQARHLPDLEAMDYFFWESAQRKVLRGTIATPGMTWVAADEPSKHALYFAGDAEVFIHFDPHWRDRALVTDLSGRALARVVPQISVPHSPEAQPAVAESMRFRRRLRNATADTVREIRRRAAEVGYVDAFADLQRRALASPRVDAVLTQPPAKLRPSQTAKAPASAADIAADFWSPE